MFRRSRSLWWLLLGSLSFGAWGCLQSQPLPPLGYLPPLVKRPAVVRDEPLKPKTRVARPAVPETTASPSLADLNELLKVEAPERPWRYIVLHHTGTDWGNVESINRAHLQRKDKRGRHWLGIGYDFVIGNGHGMGDGEIQPTFRWKQQIQGAHAGVKKYNEYGIGIAVIGNFEKTKPTPAQLASVKLLVTALCQRYGIPPENVLGHREIKATACPGKYFPLEEIRQSLLFSWQGGRPSATLASQPGRLVRMY